MIRKITESKGYKKEFIYDDMHHLHFVAMDAVENSNEWLPNTELTKEVVDRNFDNFIDSHYSEEEAKFTKEILPKYRDEIVTLIFNELLK